MDKYSKWLVVLSVFTVVMMIVGDIAYAKYRSSNHRLSSTVQAI